MSGAASKSIHHCNRVGFAVVSIVAMVLLIGSLGAVPAQAEFGLNGFDLTFTNEDGTPVTQAGSHPFAATVRFGLNYTEEGEFFYPDEDLRDAIATIMPGFVGNATTPRCSLVDFVTTVQSAGIQACSKDTVVGVAGVELGFPGEWIQVGVYNIKPPPGVAGRLGFSVLGIPAYVDVGLSEGPEYRIRAGGVMAPQVVNVLGAVLQLWGNPASPAHDHLRAPCAGGFIFGGTPAEFKFRPRLEGCPANPQADKTPLLTMPSSCTGPAAIAYEADSWQNPGVFVYGGLLTHDDSTPPKPQGFMGCGKIPFAPTTESLTTSDSAETGTGLDFAVNFDNEGLMNPDGLASSEAEKAEVTLPKGVTINPSIGEGLGVCTPADYAREKLYSEPGEGCPNSSKIGTLHLETPIVDEGIDGSVFLAQQDDPTTTEPGAENPFDSLIALYLVLRNTNLGAIVKLPLKVEPDPTTGQLVATLEDIPQVPFGHFNFHFKEGVRAALVTPPACGTYTTEAKFWPWANPDEPLTTTSSFEITRGKGGGPCPPGGIAPFNPKFEAGSENNNAGSFSPFDMRITREDGEQDMTKFSAVLPPGELGSLAGVSKCPDSAIAAARSKTGRQELASPSCPANSLIGHTLAGAGVGSALTYVKGYVYLGGPYHGDPLSVIAITPAVAGPFDAGTIVVQEALTLNPKTAEVEVDGANSDPIPHIVKGIVLKLRDLQVDVDRPNFTLNPTSCDESSARSVLFGSYLNVLDPSDDRPVDLSTRFQAANCLNLGFKPTLKLNLKGGTKRGGHPALEALYTPRKGDANINGLVVRLPRSAFLDQAHIKTICTRVQFAAGGGNGEQCPAASKYGFVKAYTPLLEEPLEGPVFLRSSNHKLPDLIFALHGLVNIEVDVRIDSAHGGIRATLEEAPDATLSKVILHMQGAKKGLIINSKNLCGATNRADVLTTAHNGKQSASKPVMKPQCGRERKRKRHGR